MAVKKPAPKAAPKKAPAKAAPKAATKTVKAAKKDTPVTVTLRQLAADIADTFDMPKKEAESVLNGTVDVIVDHLKDGNRIRLTGLGILEVKKRAARMGRNPATGEAIQIKASKKVAFRAAKELKEAV